MKSSRIVENSSKKLNSFTKGSLYISDSTLVLCTEDGVGLAGVCLHDDDDVSNAIGDYSEEWAEELFTKFTGTITLED